jgi:hypothetical protein
VFILNSSKISFFLVFFFSLFFVLKFHDSHNSKLKYIPSDTFLIGSFNLSKISDRNDYFNFIKSEKGSELIDDLKNKNIPKKIRDIIKDPSVIGLDYKKNIYFSSSLYPENNNDIYSNLSLNFIFPIKDLKLISKNINQYVDFIPDKEIDIFDGEINDFKYFLFKNRFNEKRDLVMLSYNKDVLLLSIAPLNPLVSLDLKKQLSNLEDFDLIAQKKTSNLKSQQISVWVDLDKLPINKTNFFIKDYTFIKWYFSDILLSINSTKDEVKIELQSFLKFNFYLKKAYPIINLLNDNLLYKFKSSFDFNSIMKTKKISSENQSTGEIELNHYFYLDKYLLIIKDQFYIENQILKEYIFSKFLDFITLF